MCRSIQTLFNCDPPATDEELRAAALQFVRKISGYRAPSKANEEAFRQAVEDVYLASRRLLAALVTGTAPRSRELQAARARVRRGRG